MEDQADVTRANPRYNHGMAEAAYLCKQSGIDGVEVHGSHEGYALDQFITPYTNHRTDEYGGSLENRLRFEVEIIKAIKERCGSDYPVVVRYSIESKTRDFGHGIIPADHTSKEIGKTLEESQKAIQILTEAGADAFDCDNGTYDAWYYPHPPVYMPLNTNLKEATEVKPFTQQAHNLLWAYAARRGGRGHFCWKTGLCWRW